MQKITPEQALEGMNCIFVQDKSTPPAEGTPERASYDAESLKTIEANFAAIQAWSKHEVHSWGGAMLRAARLKTHKEMVEYLSACNALDNLK